MNVTHGNFGMGHRRPTCLSLRPHGEHGRPHRSAGGNAVPETCVLRFDVVIEDTGESFRCADSRSLLEGMEALGRKGIPVGCRNGGCGVCKVQVTSGTYASRVMSREHVSEEDERCGRVLACRVRPTSDLRLTVIGKMKESVCRSVDATGAPVTRST